jgi:hypothetical protein
MSLPVAEWDAARVGNALRSIERARELQKRSAKLMRELEETIAIGWVDCPDSVCKALRGKRCWVNCVGTGGGWGIHPRRLKLAFDADAETIRCGYQRCHIPATWRMANGKASCGNHPSDRSATRHPLRPSIVG